MIPKTLRQESVEKEYYLKNQDDTYTKEVKAEDTSLRFVMNNSFIGITKGVERLASTELSDSAHLIRIFAQIDADERPTARVAHLGGGLAWLAKMLVGYGYEQDVYEIDQDIVTFLEEGMLADKINFIVGDWRDTVQGEYDIIVYDINEPLTTEDEERLNAIKKEGGKIYKLTN